MKIFKHILNTNNRNDLIDKINKIEKKADIYFRKEKDDEDEELEENDDEEENEEVEEIKSPPKIKKKNVVDYIKAYKKTTMEEFPDLNEKEINQLLIKKWNTLSDQDKYM
jgi:hypothetical protein